MNKLKKALLEVHINYYRNYILKERLNFPLSQNIALWKIELWTYQVLRAHKKWYQPESQELKLQEAKLEFLIQLFKIQEDRAAELRRSKSNEQ